MTTPTHIVVVLVVVLMIAAFAHGHDQDEDVQFGYKGDLGPEKWGNLNNAFQDCSNGKLQSPINVVKKDAFLNNKLGSLKREYNKANATLVNNGVNIGIQWQCETGNLNVDGKNYTLKESIWHTPSEHTFDGEGYVAELQHFHYSEDGKIAVVACLYKKGKSDSFHTELKDSLAKLSKETCAADEQAQILFGLVEPSYQKTSLMGKKRRKLRWSNLYTFSCTNPSILETEVAHTLQGPGFARVVYRNQPHIHQKKPLKYPSNCISTAKYNIITFLPRSIFGQFRRVANVYFLLSAILSLTPVSPFSAVSMIAPLALVVGLSLVKEAMEDWRRFMQDVNVNSRKVSAHKGDGKFGHKQWQRIQVGDVVKVEKDQFFPADLLLLSSSYEDGICYVETMNLDAETNLKVYPLGPSQILLRDSKLRNTPYVYGVVIFAGHDSKVMQNATKSPSKRSRIEKKIDYIIYILFTLLVLISLISSSGFAVKTKFGMPKWWYLQPQNTTSLKDPTKPFFAGIFHLVTALILYGYLIPISLYVSIEVVKVLQATFINQDIQMYDEETGKPAQSRTSNLNEELGALDRLIPFCRIKRAL
ncbi:hypothetical protein MRB53_017678 [Persea americana]|uniref:Uncharacterized protein n=1 Tax=Persea americana TaxID=3435 RepID=A0ACC2M5W0_PERAE|nr:hypothetical protein MRB53_017678 [Persea americana]